MGDLNVKIVSSQKELNNFTKFLLKDLQAMEYMLENDWFEKDPIHIGAEQEMCIIDEHYKPSPVALDLLGSLKDDRYTTELAKFNIEANLPPQKLEKACFDIIEDSLHEMVEKARSHAKALDSDIVLAGILPTIRKFDLDLENLTPLERYQALVTAIDKLRGKIHELRISGVDELNIRHDSAMLEACNTSFQVHLQVNPDDFVKQYNIAQLLTAPVLAVSCNSPLLFGKRLWSETRVALFQQSLDTRITSEHLRDRAPRVTFGNSWLKNSIVDIYKEDVVRFKVMLMANIEEDVLQEISKGKTPKLRALMIHNSTVYRWNRPCYGISPSGKPHLRIENRVLPAGPTVLDEVANSAFWIGLMKAFSDKYEDVTRHMEFEEAKSNFVAVSRMGMDAKLTWLDGKKIVPQDLILKELIPMAREGLKSAKVNKSSIAKYMDVIEERAKTRNTGSAWMVKSYASLLKESTREEAAIGLTAGLVRQQRSGNPVHSWENASIQDIETWQHTSLIAEEFMTTDLVTIVRDDIPEMVAEIMDWQKIRYMPVEDEKGKLIGLISSRMLLRYFAKMQQDKSKLKPKTVKSLMIKNPIFAEPETPVLEVMEIMRSNQIGCLPVVKNSKLVGIITEQNFLNITSSLLSRLGKERNK